MSYVRASRYVTTIDFLAANPIEPTRRTFTGRTFLSGEVTHMPDVLADLNMILARHPKIGFRSALCAPVAPGQGRRRLFIEARARRL
jgi:hypothetical protein